MHQRIENVFNMAVEETKKRYEINLESTEEMQLDKMIENRANTQQENLLFEKSEDFTQLFKSFNLSDKLNEDWIR